MPVPIYQAEVDAGLDVGDIARGRVSCTCELEGEAGYSAEAAEAGGDAPPAERTNLGQPDLFYTRSVLARTGFNLNGEFFAVADTWAARGSIVDKPLNLNHDKDDIVGHQTDYRVVDADMKVVDETGGPPASFSIYDTSVVYLTRGTDEKKKQVAELTEQILAGEWWVSMEAGANDFDYVLAPMPESGSPVDADLSRAQFVRRTEATAGLTKYLRQYKAKDGTRGPGVTPDGRLIGRVLRDFVFTGKGFVRKPANPSSAVFTLAGKPLSGAVAALLDGSAGYILPTSKGTPAMEEELKKATEKLATADKAVAELTASLKAAELVAAEAAAAKVTVSDELTRVKAELDGLRLDTRRASVTAAVKDALGLADDAKAAEFAATLLPLADAAIKAHLDVLAALRPAALEAKVKPPETTVASVTPVAEAKPVVVAAGVTAPTKKEALATEGAKLASLFKTPKAGKAVTTK